MDLNSRFEALKIALDQRPAWESRSGSQSPFSPNISYERHQQFLPFKSSSSARPDQSLDQPISPSELRVAMVAPADRTQTHPIPTKSRPHRPQRDAHIGPFPQPQSAVREGQERQPGDDGKVAAVGPRLQRPAWMLHHAAPSGPSASPPRRAATGTRKGSNPAARGAAPAPHRDPSAGPGPAGGRRGGGPGAGGPAASPQGSATSTRSSTGCCPRCPTADSAAALRPPSPLWLLERGPFESDAEEAEHRAIMRRLDDSAEWADPARVAELLFV
jgi:hypothetical protein